MVRKGLAVIEWTLATTAAVVMADFILEILVFKVLGCAAFLLLPLFGGVLGGVPIGALQWLVLRRYFPKSAAWIVATTLGFVGTWTAGLILFAISYNLVKERGDLVLLFVVFAVPTPIIGLAQRIVLRRWGSPTRFWVLASTVGWTAFVAVEILAPNSLAAVSQLTGSLVSRIAGYLVSSDIGATLLGGACAGAITGMALLAILPARREASQRALESEFPL